MKPIGSLYLLLIMILVVLVSCSKDVGRVGPSDTPAFAIHLLRDSTITVSGVLGQNVGGLALDTLPWLSDQDIEFYDFSSHCIYLKCEKNGLFPTLNKGLFPASWWGRPFVVVAHWESRYLGMFNSVMSSLGRPVPYIEDFENVLRYPKDVIHISSGGSLWDAPGDPRDDQAIKLALEAANLYHEGIAVTLDLIRLVQNSDTATISYTFTVTNNDRNALYLPDPDLMGDSLFNYFNNGPSFRGSSPGPFYMTDHSGSVAPVPSGTWAPGWFVRLPSGASVQREVVVPGYPHIPPDSYTAGFLYNGPVNIERAQRTMADGRYWIGPTHSTVYVFRVL